MVSYGPAILSLTLNLDAVYIFKEPKGCGNGPYLSIFIFMVAIIVVLRHLCIYPPNFQTVFGPGNMILQFLYTKFLMEILIADFWFPLEEAMFCILASVVEQIDQSEKLDTLKSMVDILKGETTQMICSYLLSSFFLLAALQATKVIDLKFLDYGNFTFIKNIYERATGFSSCFTSSADLQKNLKLQNTKSNRRPYREFADDGSSYWETPARTSAKHRPWVL